MCKFFLIYYFNFYICWCIQWKVLKCILSHQNQAPNLHVYYIEFHRVDKKASTGFVATYNLVALLRIFNNNWIGQNKNVPTKVHYTRSSFFVFRVDRGKRISCVCVPFILTHSIVWKSFLLYAWYQFKFPFDSLAMCFTFDFYIYFCCRCHGCQPRLN